MSDKLKNWFLLSRLPFLSVGIFPFILGSFFAYRISGLFYFYIFNLSFIAIIMILLATYWNGEVCDIKEDTFVAKNKKSHFSGGSQVLVKNKIPVVKVNIAIGVIISLSIILGLILQFFFKTGKLTILLGVTGILSGFFYSKPPFRWIDKGIGEILIAYCYGWLALTIGFYLQTGYLRWDLFFISLPIATSIFNVILINEFPDYAADSKAGKRNILVRIGKSQGSKLYFLVSIFNIVFFVLSVFIIHISKAFLFYLPFGIISIFTGFFMLKRYYLDPKSLQTMCALTIFVNLGTSLSYILALIFL